MNQSLLFSNPLFLPTSRIACWISLASHFSSSNSNFLASSTRASRSLFEGCLKTRADFKKSLSVASTLFVTVVQQKHGGKISNGKKKGDQKIDPNKLYNSVNFRLIGGALEVCPDNVPKQMEKDFKKELKSCLLYTSPSPRDS